MAAFDGAKESICKTLHDAAMMRNVANVSQRSVHAVSRDENVTQLQP